MEWDSNIPDWPVLRAEACAAQMILDRYATGFSSGKVHARG
jgi:hypothetical protein